MRARGWTAVVATAVLVALPVRAAAAEELLRTPDGSPLVFDRLAPGYARTATVVVTNPADTAADVALELRVTTDEENDCLRQETFVATEQCDADGGELADWLDVTLARDGTTLWTGPISDLARPRALAGQLDAGASWDLEVSLAMPVEAGNDTMTDRIGFDLVAHVAAVPGEVETEVLGVEATGGGGQPTTTGVAGVSAVAGVPTAVAAGLEALGVPHVPTGTAATAAGLAVLLGLAMLLRARRRQRPV